MSCFVTHLESAIDGTALDCTRAHTMHLDRPLWVRYDLDAVGKALTRDMLRDRAPTLWRYRELLPPADGARIVSLGEGMTPLIRCQRLGERFGLQDVWIKDESQLPTGSFKSRGQTTAITMARQFGIQRVAIPTAGNAGGAMAAYAARAGMEAYVFMPADTPAINQYECHWANAKVFLVNGLISDCARIVREGKTICDWFDMSTLKEPYRVEGKKTMGLELAEQLDWTLPDVILYPTGGGTGLVGMWKAFDEMLALGWLESDRRPRMVAVQSSGCAPIVRAFESGQRFAEFFKGAATIASGLRVPAAVGDFMILDAVRASQGTCLAVDEGRLLEWMGLATRLEGVSVCPETAACVGALEQLAASGWIQPGERVVIFNTGAAQKYVETLRVELPHLDKDRPIDWDWVRASRG